MMDKIVKVIVAVSSFAIAVPVSRARKWGFIFTIGLLLGIVLVGILKGL